MKKVLVFGILLLIILGVGGYFYYESTLVGLELDTTTESNNHSIELSVDLVMNDAVIDYESSKVNLIVNGDVEKSTPYVEGQSDYSFTNLDIASSYEVEVEVVYSFKYYKKEYLSTLKKEAVVEFVRQWEQKVEHEGSNYTPGLLALNDGGSIIFTSYYGGPAYAVGFIEKYTSGGEIAWTKRIDTGKYVDVINAFEKDDGSILIYYSNAFYNHAIMVLDSNGNEISNHPRSSWKGFPSGVIFEEPNIIYDDGELFITPVIDDYMYFIKMDKDFNVLISKRITERRELYRYKDKAKRIFLAPNGKFIVVNNIVEKGVPRKFELMNFDRGGMIFWKFTIDNGDSTIFKDLVFDGEDMVIVGYSGDKDENSENNRITYDSFVMKIAKEGDIPWNKTFDDGNFTKFNDIEVDQYGNYLVAGSASYGFDDRNTFWKLDSQGELLTKGNLTEGYYVRMIFTNDGIVVGSIVNEKTVIYKYGN